MVTHNHFVEEELRKVLSDTMAELAKFEKERDQIDNKLVKLEEERRAYEVALQGYLKRTGRQNSIEPDWDKLRQDPSHKVRLVRLARHYGGNITVKDSSALLYTKGFIKSKRQLNAYQIVRGLLDGMVDENIFEKFAPGQYRLMGAQQSLLS